MEAYFWGTRGSLPASMGGENVREKLAGALYAAGSQGKTFLPPEADAAQPGEAPQPTPEVEAFLNTLPFAISNSYGNNTSCLEIRGAANEANTHIVCDCGSGLRDFSSHIMAQNLLAPQTFHIFLSHLHWDHLSGFPFFVPAYIPGNHIHIYGRHAELESAFRNQQAEPCFPVPLSYLAADIHFHVMDENPRELAGVTVKTIQQKHPGTSYGYRFEKDGHAIVYSTDSEHGPEANEPDYPFVEFFKDADVLVFDAQYELFESIDTKANWGHSSNVYGVELATAAGVKNLCLFHNEHTADDFVLDRFLQETRNYLDLFNPESNLNVILSYDGLHIKCGQ